MIHIESNDHISSVIFLDFTPFPLCWQMNITLLFHGFRHGVADQRESDSMLIKCDALPHVVV